MSVLDRSELEASPLADLHAIASEMGLDGYRRLRKAEVIDVILAGPGGSVADDPSGDDAEPESPPQGRSTPRASRARSDASGDGDEDQDESPPRRTRSRGRRGGRRPGGEDAESAESSPPSSRAGSPGGSRAGSPGGSRAASPGGSRAGSPGGSRAAEQDRVAEGIVDLLDNGSGFLRVDSPEPSDEDVYISAAQVRRCELVSGDSVSGPVRPPRRSERYPSLVRVDTINGVSADEVTEGTHYEDLPAAFPAERFAFGSEDPTLKAIEWLTPLGRGSRATVVGGPRSGKTEALRRLADVLARQEGLQVKLVLAGARPEEITEWRGGPAEVVVALGLAASSEAQGQAVDRAVETVKRVAARGEHAVLIIDSLDDIAPAVARRALGAARNIVEGGSLTVVAALAAPLGGETTVIALDAALASTGRLPALDLVNSGTLRAELLVGDAGAEAIAQARAAALE